MRWRSVDAPDLTQDLILFDGDCVLCSRAAHFVHERDGAGRFAFVAIQSPFGRALAHRFGIDPEAPLTNLAVVNGRVSFKFDATLSVLRVLPGWRWSRIARLIPKPLRDWAYDRIARNRFAWFGRRERCWAGDPAFRARILEHAP
jgi:predicted DCC family thiol-disulfide oxidoreductase YuxK